MNAQHDQNWLNSELYSPAELAEIARDAAQGYDHFDACDYVKTPATKFEVRDGGQITIASCHTCGSFASCNTRVASRARAILADAYESPRRASVREYARTVRVGNACAECVERAPCARDARRVCSFPKTLPMGVTCDVCGTSPMAEPFVMIERVVADGPDVPVAAICDEACEAKWHAARVA